MEIEKQISIRYYLKDKFVKIKKDNLIDIIPCIVKDSIEENNILKKWEEYFISLNIPYQITEKNCYIKNCHKKILSLWKERII